MRDVIGWEEDARVPTAGFDYDALDQSLGWSEPELPEREASTADFSSALIKVLYWISSTPNIKWAGARACALLAYLDGVNAPHGRDTLARIAREAGLTRAALSKSLVALRDELGMQLWCGKRAGSREVFRQAQHESVRRNTHSSQKPKQRQGELGLG